MILPISVISSPSKWERVDGGQKLVSNWSLHILYIAFAFSHWYCRIPERGYLREKGFIWACDLRDAICHCKESTRAVAGSLLGGLESTTLGSNSNKSGGRIY